MITASINTPAKISAKALVIGDVSKKSLGLDAVDNTSDLDKPISTAQQTAIDLKADQETTYTKTEVDNAIGVLTDLAPETLDTFNELAAAIGDDADFITTITDSIGVNTTAISDETTRATAAEGLNTTAIGVNGIAIGNNATAIIDNYAATPHNTDSVIICNQGDNIQDKWEEAAALTPNGNPLSPTNLASLIVMSGTYGSIFTPSDNYINILGIGSPKISDISINGASSLNYATIDGLEIGGYEDAGNYGTIKNIIAVSIYIFVENAGYIQNVKAEQLDFETNNGIIDNCESKSTVTRGFGGFIGSINNGTIKNCTAKAASSFGMQGADGVTENCTGVNQAFIGDTSQVSGNIIEGTYRNCKGGNKSFLGQNTSTSFIKEARTNYINCTAAVNSFCFVNTVGAETHFSGTAINCTSGNNGFCRAVNGNTKILAGAIIENCTGGSNSFASTTASTNEGTILRCRTNQKGANAFRVTGTGKVRLCLDGDFNEVNLG